MTQTEKRIAKFLEAVSANQTCSPDQAAAYAERLRDDVADWERFAASIADGSIVWTYQEMNRILTSSCDSRRMNYGAPRAEFVAGLRCKYVSITPVLLPNVEETPREFMLGGGEEHSRLKAIAAVWLRTRFGASARVEIEYGYGGFRIDVAAPDENVFVECGDTECYKLNELLSDGKKVLVVPFTPDNNHGFLLEVTETGRAWFIELKRISEQKMRAAAEDM